MTDAPLDFSNFGPSVDLAAPGEGLLAGFSGTSGAAPLVSGAAALLLSARPELRGRPALAAEIIKNSARPVPSWSGKSATGGVLDLEAALLSAVPTELFLDTSIGDFPAGVAVVTNDIDFVDIDNDGDLDLFETTCSRTSVLGQFQLYVNNAGVFTNATTSLIPVFEGSFCDADVGDIDGDGWSDIVLGAFLPDGTPSQNANQVLMNVGGSFVLDPSRMPVDSALSRALELCDVDSDGDLDLYVANVTTPHVLLRNDGGAFVDISMTLTGPPISSSPHKVLCQELDASPGNLCDGLTQQDCAVCASPKHSIDGLLASGAITPAQEATCRTTRTLVTPELVIANGEGTSTSMLRRDFAGMYQDLPAT
jgi:hypothetical protein